MTRTPTCLICGKKLTRKQQTNGNVTCSKACGAKLSKRRSPWRKKWKQCTLSEANDPGRPIYVRLS